MTKQDAYEYVRAYLTREGARRAFDPNPPFPDEPERFPDGVCRYETVIDGERHHCAVGCLLKREDLDRSMASYVGSVESLFTDYGMPDYILAIGEGTEWEQQEDATNFLGELQACHDSLENWPDGKFDPTALDVLAYESGLTVVS